ncbi:MAG: amidohydrolase [Aquificaceae bacterium]
MYDLVIKSAIHYKTSKKVDVAIKDGKIAKISEEIKESAKETINASGQIIMPSFANMHSHLPMSLLKGIGADLPLMQWLEKAIWPIEKALVSPQFVKDGALLGIAEAIKSGTTLIMDMYFFEEELASLAKSVNIRLAPGFGILDFPTAVAKTPKEYLSRAKEFLKAFKNEPLITPCICPHSVYSCSKETLLSALELATLENVPIHTHCAENIEEIKLSIEKNGLRPLEYLHSLGLLTGKTFLAHCVYLEKHEREMLAHSGSYVVHCPESNLKLSSGIAPIVDYIKENIKVLIGTDGPASNDDLDMLGEIRTMTLLQKLKNPKEMTADLALSIAHAGFKALSINAGTLEEEAEADLVLIKTDLKPIDPQAQIVYSANRSDITTVLCKGKPILYKGELTTIDEEELKVRATKWRDEVLRFI